jgi:hypothetical protein
MIASPSIRYFIERWLIGGAALLLLASAASAGDLKGKVVGVSERQVRMVVEGDYLPQVGDEVKISFRVPGGPELPIGTWKVSKVEPDFVEAEVVTATGKPAVDQIATIISPAPSRRGAGSSVATRQPETRSQSTSPLASPSLSPQAPSPWAPGASAPSPFSRRVNISQMQLPVGPMKIGEGRFERVGSTFIINSSKELYTWHAISIQPASEFYASVRIRVERGSGSVATAGIILSVDGFKYPQEGDVFFGKNDSQGLLLAGYQGGQWAHVPVGRPLLKPLRAGEIDWFEVVKHQGIYEFRLNGARLATSPSRSTGPAWVIVYADKGNRAEFHDWQVERPE